MTSVTQPGKHHTVVYLSKPFCFFSFFCAVDTTRLLATCADDMVMMCFTMNFVMLFTMLCKHGMDNIEKFKQIENTIDRDSIHAHCFLNHFIWRKHAFLRGDDMCNTNTRRGYLLFFVFKEIHNPLRSIFFYHTIAIQLHIMYATQLHLSIRVCGQVEICYKKSYTKFT